MRKGDTKITVKVPTSLLRRFKRQIDGLNLKRDAFLVSMIGGELPYLEKDMDGRRLTSAARRHIAGSLKRMGTSTINVVAPESIAASLTKATKRHNLVRDAFVSRLIALLRSEKSLLDLLDLPERIERPQFRSSVDAMPTSPLKAMEEVKADPLFYLRVAMEERHGTGLYLADLPPRLHGLACYLDDGQVPGTVAYKARQGEEEQLLGLDSAAPVFRVGRR